MENFEIRLPKLGESIVSATVVSIYKKENDYIDKDETLMEVATDKVNSEVPSPVEGRIVSLEVKENELVNVGDVIARVAVESKVADEKIKSPVFEKTSDVQKNFEKKNFFSPAVLKYAQENGMSLLDLEKIEGTGDGQRVTKKDVEKYLFFSKKSDGKELSCVRQAIANTMIKSLSVPHAYLVDEIDVTSCVNYISENKRKFLDDYDVKLTITSFAAKAIVKAIESCPLVNSTYKDGKIVVYENINLGVAVNVNDDVIVPVIHNIEKMDLIGISKCIYEMATKAKEHKLVKKDLEKGTVTLSNFGMSKVLMGFPIIKYPEAAIIAMGAIKKKPLVIDDEIKIRLVLKLTLSFDHRVFDGIYACRFINEIKNYLELSYERAFS